MKKWASSMTAVLVTLSNGNLLAAERYRIDPEHTFAHFAVVHTGVSSVRGRMGVTKGSATLDREKETAEINVDLDPRSIDTGVKKLDAVLSDEMFFNVAKYKTAHYSGRAVKFQDGVPWEFEGDLTLHGVTKPVVLHVTLLAFGPGPRGQASGWEATTKFKKSDFGINGPAMLAKALGDEVTINITIEAGKKA